MFSQKYYAVPFTEDAAHLKTSLSCRRRNLLVFTFLCIQALEIALFLLLGRLYGCTAGITQKPTSCESPSPIELFRYPPLLSTFFFYYALPNSIKDQYLQEFSRMADFEEIFHQKDLDARVHNDTYWRNLFPSISDSLIPTML